MSRMGSRGAPNSLNVRATLSSSSRECFSSGRSIQMYSIDARKIIKGELLACCLFFPVYQTTKQQQKIVYSYYYFIKTNKYTLFNVVKVLLCVHVAMFL